MVKGIHIIKYRKLENMELEFSKGINVLSGTNGTCKTSLLHIISNAFQAVTKKCEWLTDASCLDVIRQVNNMTNPKIESLTKGDKTHNDPANGIKGTIFSVDYYGHTSLEFRKHNSKLNNRYAVKPWYRPGTTEKLPYCPVIYLGLTRLYPFGEYMNDEAVQKLKKNLPEEYQNIISTIYNSLTGINISSVTSQKMGDIKTRADFESDKDGIDSNTISAGEDNLFIIICALVSLRYYFERITSTNEIESILLIDEFDATLHPSLQERLLKIFRHYSEAYKIQIIFTTHSLSTVDAALKSRDNVIYLIDNVTNAIVMESPDIYKIIRHLSGITGDDIYLNKSIPIFTEDAEARVFLNTLFDYSILNEPDAFCELVEQTALTENEWAKQRSIYLQLDKSKPLELGFSTFYLNRTNVSGVVKGGMIGGKGQNGQYGLDARFNRTTLIRKINNIAARKDQIVLLNQDAKDLLQPHELRRFYKTFINLDPPYVKKGAQLYKNAFSETDHRELCELVKRCNRKWIVTYDVCPLVAELYSSYRSSYLDVTYSIQASKKAKEYIFFSDNLILPQEIILHSK